MENPLLDFIANDPMARREFLDNHERIPIWAKLIYHIRLILGV